MSVVQRLITAIVPKGWAAAMEADSRRWMMRCRCGVETSIWEMGGIRYKAAGTPWTMGHCGSCGKSIWGRLYRRDN
jgi:hypothetical protein